MILLVRLSSRSVDGRGALSPDLKDLLDFFPLLIFGFENDSFILYKLSDSWLSGRFKVLNFYSWLRGIVKN